MEKLKKILEAEIAQRKLAMKHNPLNKAEIAEELDELNQGLVKLFAIPDVSGSFSDWYNRGFKDGLDNRSLKCRCGNN